MEKLITKASLRQFLSRRTSRYVFGVLFAVYAPIFAFLLYVGTPRFLGFSYPRVYFWCALVSLAFLSIALIWKITLVRASAWIVVAFVGFWLAANFAFTFYFLTQTKLQLNESLSTAIFFAASYAVRGIPEMYIAWVPLFAALLFAVFFETSSNPPLNRSLK